LDERVRSQEGRQSGRNWSPENFQVF
jgi:hypothetical protein